METTSDGRIMIYSLLSAALVTFTEPSRRIVVNWFISSSALTLNFVPSTLMSDAKVWTVNGRALLWLTSKNASPQRLTSRESLLNIAG